MTGLGDVNVTTPYPSGYDTAPTILPSMTFTPITTNLNPEAPTSHTTNPFASIQIDQNFPNFVSTSNLYNHVSRNVIKSTTENYHSSSTTPLVNNPNNPVTSTTTNYHSSSTTPLVNNPNNPVTSTTTNYHSSSITPLVNNPNNPVTSTTTNYHSSSTTPLVNSQNNLLISTAANYHSSSTTPLVNNPPTSTGTNVHASSTIPLVNSQATISPTTSNYFTTKNIVSSVAPNQPFPQTTQAPSDASTTEAFNSNKNPVTTASDTSQPSGDNTLNNNDQQSTQANTGGTPTQLGCICSNSTKNLTTEEVQEAVKELVKNLTVPVKETSAFKRSKMSMPDERQSSKVIGAVGVVSMTTVFAAVVAMDAMHIMSAINFVKSIFIKG